MYRELSEAGNPSPKYEQIAFMIVGTAYSSMSVRSENPTENPTENVSLTPLERKIIEVLKHNPDFTQKQVADEIGIGFVTVREYIGKLRKKDVVTRIGPDKGGYWQVNENPCG